MPNFDQGGRSKKKKKNPIKLVNNLIKKTLVQFPYCEMTLQHTDKHENS